MLRCQKIRNLDSRFYSIFNFRNLALILIIFVLSIPNLELFAAQAPDSVNVEQQVTPGCGNGICETGENSTNCPADCPAPPAPPPAIIGPSGGSSSFIYDIVVTKITSDSATITWKTSLDPALCKLFLGETQEYEKESISEYLPSLNHTANLRNLSPEMTYHFKIFCQSQFYRDETKDQQFKTLKSLDFTPPANVSNFEAIAGDSQITIKWQNPPDSDFKAVKIMRSEKFYPTDPWEGTPVYNDKGNNFTDTGLVNGKRYYYTAFAYDKAGNYSSGAIAAATPQKPGVPPEIPPEIPEIPPELVPPDIGKLTLKDFDFFQDGKKIQLVEDKIDIKTESPLTISINYEKVPEVLKTIMVTLEKTAPPEGGGKKFFSFLLRINSEKNAYQAIIAPPEAGIYPFIVNVLDYKNQAFKKISGELGITGITKLPTIPIIPWQKKYRLYLYILGGLIILAGMVYLVRKFKSQRLRVKATA